MDKIEKVDERRSGYARRRGRSASEERLALARLGGEEEEEAHHGGAAVEHLGLGVEGAEGLGAAVLQEGILGRLALDNGREGGGGHEGEDEEHAPGAPLAELLEDPILGGELGAPM